jgi:REP element-mobilizing transposase RayT
LVLDPDIRERLWPYMGGIAKQNGIIPKCIGGVSDHVHLLVTLPTKLAVAKAVQLIKAGSSAWIHQSFPNLRNFAWQQGYGAFSVSISQVQETVHYIEQQIEHHRGGFPGTSCQATIGLSLRDALGDTSQQHLAKLEPIGECYESESNVSGN